MIFFAESLKPLIMAMFIQRIHFGSIITNIGLLIHVPAIMAIISALVAIIFQEDFAIGSFLITGIVAVIFGQLLYRCCKGKQALHLWDAMIIAGLGWIVCSIIGAIPLIFASKAGLSLGMVSPPLEIFSKPTNAFFEAMSGFTSTGLTMLKHPSELPYIIQWWRSFMEWTGGVGLIVFILSLLHLRMEGYQLYYAEAHTEKIGKNVDKTAAIIWQIYGLYTVFGVVMFWLLGMPIWEAINHAMTAISTGGFTTKDNSFAAYGLSIQIMALWIMLLGAINFAGHYKLLTKGNVKQFWQYQHYQLLFALLFFGGAVILFLDRWIGSNFTAINSFFEWGSALTTCGFSSTNLPTAPAMIKLFLIFGMIMGGTAGSTVGGIKLQRVISLYKGVGLRISAITSEEEREILKDLKESKDEEPAGIELPRKQEAERLYAAGVLAFLWVCTLATGWFFILRWTPQSGALNAFFDVVSAMSNVGLSTDVIGAQFHTAGKWIFILIMWIGRLEIIPALIILFTTPLSIWGKRKKRRKFRRKRV